jgi:hypothetical protein
VPERLGAVPGVPGGTELSLWRAANRQLGRRVNFLYKFDASGIDSLDSLMTERQ